MKLSRRNTAERHVAHPRLLRKRKAGAVTGGERLFIRHGGLAGEKRSDGVQNIPAGKIECGCDLCLPDRLAVPLPLHQLRTGKAELNPRIGVNGVVDTAVTGAEAPEQLAVGGVDNGVALQRGDVALPQVKGSFPAAGGGGQAFKDGNALLGKLDAQVFVLHLQKLRAGIPGRAHIEQCAQQQLLPGGIVRDGQLPVFGGFCQQAAEQKTAAFGLGHRKTSFAVPNGKTP